MSVDKIFCDMLDNILKHGKDVTTRNSLTRRLTGMSAHFETTPLISIRRTAWKNALREFEWFLSGSNNINDLHEKVQHWWKPWATKGGLILNNYSSQFRSFVGHEYGVDQVQYLIESLKDHPFSRRAVITTWNTADMVNPDTPITNCHGTTIQCFVDPETNKLDMIMYQRSSDMVLGLPHNFIQYWAFLMYLAHHSGREVGSLTWIGGDCHIYTDHVHMAVKMINHNELDNTKTPMLKYNPSDEEFKADDFSLNMEYTSVIKESLKMTV